MVFGSSTEPEQSNKIPNQDRLNDRKRKDWTWDQVADILVHAAKEVCGTQGKRGENPWITGAEMELELMREEINKWIAAGNNRKRK